MCLYCNESWEEVDKTNECVAKSKVWYVIDSLYCDTFQTLTDNHDANNLPATPGYLSQEQRKAYKDLSPL